MFSGAGYSKGILDWGEKTKNRRSELASLFAQFKKDNPYATANEYTNFLESQIGGDELYLRNAIPSKDILAKMEKENQRRYAYDRSIEDANAMAKNLAIGETLRNSAKSYVLSDATDEDIYDSLTATLSPGDAEDQLRKRALVKSAVGELGTLRNRERGAYGRKMANEIATMIRDSDFDPDDKEAMDNLFADFDPDNKYSSWLSSYKKNITSEIKRKRDREIKEQQMADDNRRMQFLNLVSNNERFARMMTPGTESSVAVENEISEMARMAGFEKNDPIIINAINKVRDNRSFYLEEDTKKLAKQNADTASAEYEKRHEAQKASVKSYSEMLGFNEQQTLMAADVSRRYLIPQDMQPSMLQFIKEKGDQYGARVATAWYESLPEQEKAFVKDSSMFNQIARSEAASSVNQPQTAADFLKYTKQRSESIKQSGSKLVSNLVAPKAVEDAFKSYAGTKKLIHDIEAMDGKLTKLHHAHKKEIDDRLGDQQKWITGRYPAQKADFDEDIAGLENWAREQAAMLIPVLDQAYLVAEKMEAQAKIRNSNSGGTGGGGSTNTGGSPAPGAWPQYK